MKGEVKLEQKLPSLRPGNDHNRNTINIQYRIPLEWDHPSTEECLMGTIEGAKTSTRAFLWGQVAEIKRQMSLSRKGFQFLLQGWETIIYQRKSWCLRVMLKRGKPSTKDQIIGLIEQLEEQTLSIHRGNQAIPISKRTKLRGSLSTKIEWYIIKVSTLASTESFNKWINLLKVSYKQILLASQEEVRTFQNAIRMSELERMPPRQKVNPWRDRLLGVQWSKKSLTVLKMKFCLSEILQRVLKTHRSSTFR